MLDPNTVAFPPLIGADQIALIAKALAHPARVRIIAFLLSKSGCIGGDIVDEVGLAQSTVSEHLRILKEAGIVQGTIEYPRICYSLDPTALAPMQGLIEAIAARPSDGEAPVCHTPPRLRSQGDRSMTTITVYDPAMCCSTGLCGTDVDQRLVDLAADLDWLKAKGVSVQRFGLSREPAEFAANDTIRRIMQESDGDDLPVFLVDGALKAKARYPSRAELADWAGVTAPEREIAGQTPETLTASEKPVEASGCCGGAAKSAPAQDKAGSCC